MNTPDSGVHVSNIRSVTGGEYVGGFLGLADVSAVAQVSDGGNTNILAELLKLGGTSVLDAFRTFVDVYKRQAPYRGRTSHRLSRWS